MGRELDGSRLGVGWELDRSKMDESRIGAGRKQDC